MVRPLKVGPRETADLSVISRIGSEQLEAVLSRLNQLEAPMIAASELRSLAHECLSSEEQAVPLARQLISLATYCRLLNEEPKDTVENLLAGIEDTDIGDEEKTNLKTLAPVLTKLLKQDSVNLSAKALDLGYDYANIYRRGNVITDIRPVFDDNKDRIVGAVISNTLTIHFGSASGRHELSVALDNDDILALRDACDNALKKAKKAKALVMDRKDLKAFITGEETYGFN